MTIEEIRESTEVVLLAEDIAHLLRTKPQRLRLTARDHPTWLGFPVIRTSDSNVVFPRKPFLAFLGEKEEPPADADGKANDNSNNSN